MFPFAVFICETWHFCSSRYNGRSLTCACVSLWGARAVKAQRAGSHAHANLLHPDPLQVHEESRLAGQAAIVVGAGQTATLLAPRTHTRYLC